MQPPKAPPCDVFSNMATWLLQKGAKAYTVKLPLTATSLRWLLWEGLAVLYYPVLLSTIFYNYILIGHVCI